MSDSQPGNVLGLDKHFTFECRGGPADGAVFSTDSECEDDRNSALVVFFQTNHATVGCGYRGAALGAASLRFYAGRVRRSLEITPAGEANWKDTRPQSHKYVVADRQETEDRILVRLEYAPKES